MFIFRPYLLLAYLAACFLMGCAFNPATGDLDVVTMSEKKEIAIGKEMHEELVKNKALYEDPKLKKYLQSVGQRLALNSHRKDLEYHFNII
ncbi:MAG: peptidase M48, partial [Spongiibacteraceae bacterium]|nr:peptidase M48 [Spongiibacteraceae bacterium]